MLAKLVADFIKSSSSSAKGDDGSTGLMDIVRTLRTLGGTLGAQAGLYGELLQLEIALEKQRLMRLAVLFTIALVALWCFLLFGAILIVALVWDTEYRIPVIGALVVLFVIVIFAAVWRVKAIINSSGKMFASIREELAADIALIKSQL